MEETSASEEKQSTQPEQNLQDKSDTVAVTVKRGKVQDLYSWKSLNRPVWQYSKDVFTTLGAIAILVAIIFAFFQEWMAILVVFAAYFLFYALSKVPPVEVEHKITSEGIISMDRAYLWSELGPFWFSQKGGDFLMHVAHRSIFGQLIILVDSDQVEKVRDILSEYLPFIELPQKSMAEKLSDWFSSRFPIEKMAMQNFKPPEGSPPPTAS